MCIKHCMANDIHKCIYYNITLRKYYYQHRQHIIYMYVPNLIVCMYYIYVCTCIILIRNFGSFRTFLYVKNSNSYSMRIFYIFRRGCVERRLIFKRFSNIFIKGCNANSNLLREKSGKIVFLLAPPPTPHFASRVPETLAISGL